MQIALLCITQLYYHFSKGVSSEREPVLSYVYKSYEHTHFPNFGGGLIGFYLFKLFIPLISIAGVIIITILLLASSIILLLNLRHRDVSKSLFESMKSSSESASESFKEKRETSKARKEEKAQLKADRAEEKKERKNKKDLNKKTLRTLVIFLKFHKIMIFLFMDTVIKKIRAIVYLSHAKSVFLIMKVIVMKSQQILKV